MSLNLKGMTREEAVDDSVKHFEEILNHYSEANKILTSEYGFRPGTIPSEYKRMTESLLQKYPKYTNIMPYLFDSIKKGKIKDRLENLKKVRSADKKGYLESLTLIRNTTDGFLDVNISKSKQPNKNIAPIKTPSVSGMVNTSGSLSVKNRLSMMKASNTSRPSSPRAEPSTPLVNTPNPEVNDPWWYETKTNKGTYYYTANGRTTWNRPSKVAPTSGGRTQKRRNKNKNKKNKKSRKH